MSKSFRVRNFRVKEFSDTSVCPKSKTLIFQTGNFRVFNFWIFGGIRKYFCTENFRIYGRLCTCVLSERMLTDTFVCMQAWLEGHVQVILPEVVYGCDVCYVVTTLGANLWGIRYVGSMWVGMPFTMYMYMYGIFLLTVFSE